MLIGCVRGLHRSRSPIHSESLQAKQLLSQTVEAPTLEPTSKYNPNGSHGIAETLIPESCWLGPGQAAGGCGRVPQPLNERFKTAHVKDGKERMLNKTSYEDKKNSYIVKNEYV